MRGTLEVIRKPPHFIQFILSLSLEDDIVDNLTLSRRIESSITIYRMRKDEQGSIYILDYIVPLHTISGSDSYLIDDMIGVERWIASQKPQSLALIRISLTKEGKILCGRTLPLDIRESTSEREMV